MSQQEFTVVLNPTAVTQTEENSLRVENNSCRDQRVPNSAPPVTEATQSRCTGTEAHLTFVTRFSTAITLGVTSVMCVNL